MAIAQVEEKKEEKGVLKYGMTYENDVISSNVDNFSMSSGIEVHGDCVNLIALVFRCRPCYR